MNLYPTYILAVAPFMLPLVIAPGVISSLVPSFTPFVIPFVITFGYSLMSIPSSC